MKILLKIFTLCIVCLFLFCGKVSAENIYRITNANFDTSNSMIVLSAADTAEGVIAKDIKLIKLDPFTSANSSIQPTTTRLTPFLMIRSAQGGVLP